MTIERDLEQAFERRSGDATQEPGAWNAVHQGIRRSHRTRIVGFATLAAATVVAAGIVAPLMLHRGSGSLGFTAPEPGKQAPQGASPTGPPPKPSGELTEVPPDNAVFRNDEVGYWLVVPSYYDISIFESTYEFRPQGEPSLASGKPTFAISIALESAAYDSPIQGESATDGRLGDMPVKRYELSTPGGEHQVLYRADATYIHCPPSAHCPYAQNKTTLAVTIHASTDKHWQSNSAEALRIVNTLARLAATQPSTSFEVRTLLGSVAKHVTFDDLTLDLTKFLEQRILSGDATTYLSSNAKHQYDTHEGGLQLYDPPVPPGYLHYDYVAFRIIKRRDAAANSAEFTVKLIEGPQDGGTMGGLAETIALGPGTTWKGDSAAVIVRSARYEGCDKQWASCQDLGGR